MRIPDNETAKLQAMLKGHLFNSFTSPWYLQTEEGLVLSSRLTSMKCNFRAQPWTLSLQGSSYLMCPSLLNVFALKEET